MSQDLAPGSSPSFYRPSVTGAIAGSLLATDPGTSEVRGNIPPTTTCTIAMVMQTFGPNVWSVGSLLVGAGLSRNTDPFGPSITLDTVQSITSGSTPTWNSIIATGLTASTMVSCTAGKQLQSTTLAGANGLTLAFAGSTLTASASQPLQNTASPTLSLIHISEPTRRTPISYA